VPLFAYFYQWFNPSSWNRGKINYPTLGRYSSSDVYVMRKQIAWAKAAGIDGFLVSWKDTPALDERLAALASLAAAAHFKLGIEYEGLNFQRDPLPVATVAHDLSYFVLHYGSNPVFSLLGRHPLVIWDGTWKFTPSDVASVTQPLQSKLVILASAENAASYESIAGLVDGDAYYWSSVNPLTTPGYQQRLNALSNAVHTHGGLWIAPAAPGYDARAVGGTRVVPRRHGETLRQELGAALASSPDAIGLISWNEFSENTVVEPSTLFGDFYLRQLADFEHARAPQVSDFDSSGPGGFDTGPGPFLLLGLLVTVFIGSGVVITRRRRKARE